MIKKRSMRIDKCLNLIRGVLHSPLLLLTTLSFETRQYPVIRVLLVIGSHHSRFIILLIRMRFLIGGLFLGQAARATILLHLVHKRTKTRFLLVWILVFLLMHRRRGHHRFRFERRLFGRRRCFVHRIDTVAQFHLGLLIVAFNVLQHSLSVRNIICHFRHHIFEQKIRHLFLRRYRLDQQLMHQCAQIGKLLHAVLFLIIGRIFAINLGEFLRALQLMLGKLANHFLHGGGHLDTHVHLPQNVGKRDRINCLSLLRVTIFENNTIADIASWRRIAGASCARRQLIV
mmetsp:Transcript_20356/g.32580  ORF Transcript_20356/g.32580 Transcript_20356/m.32580 type:complete len:287 (-) Transcript_20356:642-1502(-)